VIAIVGFLAFTELTSGIIQGVLPPTAPELGKTPQIATGDLNWITGSRDEDAAVAHVQSAP
jgi:hypothetical protein